MSEGAEESSPYANNLKALIRLRGYKIVEVANELQIPRSTLYGYLSGRRPIPKGSLRDIAHLIACETNEFRYECVTDPRAQGDYAALLAASGAEAARVETPEQSIADHAGEEERDDALSEVSGVLFAPPELKMPVTDADYAAWFGKKLAYIVTVMMHRAWQGRDYHTLQAWLNKEIQMFEAIKPLWASDGYSMSRRQAIISIAALPLVLLPAVQHGHRSALVKEEFLSRCAASIAACWHLMAGRDFEEVGEAVTQYLSVLTKWSQTPSEFQQQSAELATQGSLLLGLVSLHTGRPPHNLHRRVAYSTQAVQYGKVTENQSLYTIALIHLANAMGEIGQSTDMLVKYQMATQNLDGLSLALQSKALSQLAYAHAQNGQVQEALRVLGEARAKLPAPSDFVPVFVDLSGLPQLIQFEGQTHLSIGDSYPESDHYQQAWNALAQIEQLPPDVVIPERIRVEIVNHQALAAVKMSDLDRSYMYLQRGIEGARALGSEKRRQEAVDIYWQARRIWPNEARVRDLGDLLVSMN